MNQQDLPVYEHIQQNDFVYRKHKKQKEEDVAVCNCRVDYNDPDSACGDGCLNVLTSTECTPGFCRCGIFCKNQRFQKCEYAKTRLFQTEGRGWGLLADEDIKAGQFIIEYCGEVISWKEAKRRSQAYESQGLKDAFIISLNSSESIDATKKGSLAKFINHSCQPNCETRKWYVLGEIRVGIFAKQDISVGTELAYDYNFEWYGGAKVRCLCGAANCSGFLGAKSSGFQEDSYLWEDNDERYSVEKIPLYDSAEDEPSAGLGQISRSLDSEHDAKLKVENAEMVTSVSGPGPEQHMEATTALAVDPLVSVPTEDMIRNHVKTEASEEETKIYPQDTEKGYAQNIVMISRVRSITSPVPKKRKKLSNGKSKLVTQVQVDAKYVANLLASKEAQNEVLMYEEFKDDATAQLSSLYDEIRPAIEEHERDNQDSVATSVAEQWIESCCQKMKAEFDLYSSMIKNVLCMPLKLCSKSEAQDADKNEVKLLEFKTS